MASVAFMASSSTASLADSTASGRSSVQVPARIHTCAGFLPHDNSPMRVAPSRAEPSGVPPHPGGVEARLSAFHGGAPPPQQVPLPPKRASRQTRARSFIRRVSFVCNRLVPPRCETPDTCTALTLACGARAQPAVAAGVRGTRRCPPRRLLSCLQPPRHAPGLQGGDRGEACDAPRRRVPRHVLLPDDGTAAPRHR